MRKLWERAGAFLVGTSIVLAGTALITNVASTRPHIPVAPFWIFGGTLVVGAAMFGGARGWPPGWPSSSRGTGDSVASRLATAWPVNVVSDPVQLGVQRSINVSPPGIESSPLPLYVPRAHDTRLRQVIDAAVESSAMVVLVGDSSTGKTRALWEAMQHLSRQWRLYFPVEGRVLRAALADHSIRPHTVLWLDDARLYLNPELGTLARDNAVMLRELINNPATRPVLVAATLWRDPWREFTAQPDRPRVGADARGRPGVPEDVESAHGQVSALLRTATHIPIPDAFEGSDLERMRTAATADPSLAYALERTHDGKVTQYLAGALQNLERYATAPQHVKALITAAIDARRLGHGTRLPEQLLLEAAPGYVDDDTWNLPGGDRLSNALAAAAEDWRGLPGPLTEIRPRVAERTPHDPEYRLADILEQSGARSRRNLAPPEEFWAAAVRHGQISDLNALASAAYRRGRYRDAARLSLRAADAGDTGALVQLASMREHAGDLRDAYRLCQLAVNAGDTSAPEELARILELAQDLAEVELMAWLCADPVKLRREALKVHELSEQVDSSQNAEGRTGGEHTDHRHWDTADTDRNQALVERVLRSEEAGDSGEAERVALQDADWNPVAVTALVMRRDEAGESADAVRLALHVAGIGGSNSRMPLSELIRVREEAGKYQEAEHLALSLPGVVEVELLVRVREEAERREEAEGLALKGLHAGHPEALRQLARRRGNAGEKADAERLYRLALSSGDPSVLQGLALLREEAGDRREAEALASQAAAAGHGQVLEALAQARDTTGDRDGAEQLALKATESGCSWALVSLARIRGEAGDLAAAERAYQLAADTGDTDALPSLARMWAKAGDLAAAERAYQLAADTGDTFALISLAGIRERSGNREGAEQALRLALNAGNHGALRRLAEMQAKPPIRWIFVGPTDYYLSEMQQENADHGAAERLLWFGLDANGKSAAPWTTENLDR
jgi:hypothetical protein